MKAVLENAALFPRPVGAGANVSCKRVSISLHPQEDQSQMLQIASYCRRQICYLPVSIMARQKISMGRNDQRAGATKGRQDAGKTKSILPPAWRAAMATEVEQRLRTSIRRHGAKKLHDALLPLLAKCKLNDWLCVAILPSASNGNGMSHPGESAAAKISRRW